MMHSTVQNPRISAKSCTTQEASKMRWTVVNIFTVNWMHPACLSSSMSLSAQQRLELTEGLRAKVSISQVSRVAGILH